MKKLLVAILTLSIILTMFSLVSCDNNSTTTNSQNDSTIDKSNALNLVENGQSVYSIVRARSDTKLAGDLSVSLRTEIENKTGVALQIANDNKGEPTEYEILLGKTSRQESQDVYVNLGANEYVIKWVGKKLVIAGYDDLMLAKAYDYFIANFVAISSGKIGVPETFVREYKMPTREEQLKQNALVAYPEYPEQIKRDYDYTVTVTQGNKTISVPVYNVTRQEDNYGGSNAFGNMYKRFAEFAFNGDPVTVSVTVNIDVETILVAPTSKGYKTKVDGNTISFTISEPGQVVLKVNGDNNTVLPIFADLVEIEEEIPSSFDENVIYYTAGWHEVESGELKVPSGKTLYLAPGCVLNARVQTDGANVKVMGRGMILDPFKDRINAPKYTGPMRCNDATNLILQDIKLCDTRSFNLTFYGCNNANVSNVKILSNQISTDGISLFGDCQDLTVSGCFLNVEDNLFVFGGVNQKNILFENCVVAGYALAYPQGGVNNVVLKNIDCIRLNSFFKNTQQPSVENPDIKGLVLENICAEDIDSEPIFIYLQRQGTGKKEITMRNVSLPKVIETDTYRAYSGSNYSFNFENVWIKGELLTDVNNLAILNRLSDTIHTYKAGNKEDAHVGERNEVTMSHTAIKIKIGDYKLDTLSTPAFEKDGTVYVAIKDLLNELGVNATLNGTTLSFNGKTAKVELKDGVAVAPISFLNDNEITTADYDASSKTVKVKAVYNGENLIENARFESGYSFEWCTFNFTKIELTKSSHSGEYAIKVPGLAEDGATGYAQYFTKDLYKLGAGTYKLECWAKVETTSIGKNAIIGVVPASYQLLGNDYTTIPLTTVWQKISYEFTISDVSSYNKHFILLGAGDDADTTVLYDDVKLVKVK